MENLSFMKKKKILAKEKLEQISKETDQAKLVNLYDDILKINNTDRTNSFELFEIC